MVTYRAGSVPEVVEDGVTGVLAPAGDVAALAEATARLLRDPELRRRMGEAGRQRVAERFSWEKTARTMWEAMERLGR